MSISLYIHIPFCRRKCLYCDFFSVIYEPRAAASYIDVIMRQIEAIEEDFSTVYIGGGTPSALAPELLARLLKALSPKLRAGAEFTVEANPESLDDERIKLLLGYGVNRLSIGVQSLEDTKLKRLGRIHNARKAAESVILASKRGFSNISIDLIFGVWDEKQDRWKNELDQAVKLPVQHVSCYALTYEKDTPLFKALQNKSITPLDDDIAAAMYETAIDILSLRGFKQYEISNFAREGFECKHNLSYWENNPYIGLGASAVSYVGGVRSRNVAGVEEYVRRFDKGQVLADSSEKLSPERRAKETAAVKIRTRDGIDFAWFKEKTDYDLQELEKRAIPGLLEKGLIRYKKENNTSSGIQLKRKGFLFCDTVSSTLL
ncbi:MAG: radical SAM family heme chaperone HemW [Candidatus Omnitrophica bacterium]|nr:radical SAM family heme chaperone HemW [Candidatus Omnitrophota bacterium]